MIFCVLQKLHTNVANQDISLDNFQSPFRKDRVDRLGGGGGVAIYVKNDYHVVHRNDLEVLGVECVWVEIKISKNHPVLIGTFYMPHDSLNYTFDLIEHSIDLAVDTGINTIVVLGDFNEDQLKPQNNKMSNIFVKYNMNQFINEPTHFTENSSSCIDLISSTDPNVIDLTRSRRFRIEFGIPNEIIRKYSETAWKFGLCHFLGRKKCGNLNFVIFYVGKSSESWT